MAKTMLYTPKRKLSAKDIIGQDVRKFWKNHMREKPNEIIMEVYSIGGVVAKIDSVPTAFGESTRLIGQFIAVNLMTKQQFKSNRAYLPTICAESVMALFAERKPGEAVKFSYKISMVDDELSNTGYIYEYETMMQEKKSTDIAEIEQLMGIAVGGETLNPESGEVVKGKGK